MTKTYKRFLIKLELSMKETAHFPEEAEMLHRLVDPPEERFDQNSLLPVRSLASYIKSVFSRIKEGIRNAVYTPTSSDYHGN